MALRLVPGMLACVAFWLKATDARAQTTASIYSGDWVGELRLAKSATFIQVKFNRDASPPTAQANLPLENRWSVPLGDLRVIGPVVTFSMPLQSDTAQFHGALNADVIDGELRLRSGVGRLHLIRRMAYDSTLVRPLAGNYRISPKRVISMGPMDEASGWLSFFDSQTRRGGILYAMSDSVFFTGPSYGVDYPVAIRATVRRNRVGKISGIRWDELGRSSREARRLDDYRQEDVVFSNGSVRLAGNLTIPTTTGPHPAVILIHGAGGTIPTRDFGYWSTYFAGHGIAVLAFDKRGGGASTAALAQTGVRDATVRVFNRANHGLLMARTGYARESRSLAVYVPGFQDELVAWISERARRKQ